MNISKRVREEIAVLDIAGKLAGGVGGVTLSETVLEQVQPRGQAPSSPPQVLLNLAACTGADSLGIGELISLHVTLTARRGALKLLDPPASIRDLLRATQLISMFEIFEDEERALQSFSASS